MLTVSDLYESITWDSIDSAVTWANADSYYSSWDQTAGETEERRFWLGQDGKLKFLTDRVNDFDPSGGTTPIEITVETGDLDFNQPDQVKSFLRLSVKIDRVLTSDTVFIISGSTDKGRNWKALGTLTIAAGDDENFVTFRLSGSTGRFRVKSSSEVNAYIISELVIGVRGVGLESHLGPED